MTNIGFDSVPPLTVIVPVYNEEDAIEDTIHDLHKAFEKTSISYSIIVVDDHSTDNTPSVLEKLPTDRLRVIRHGRNRGYGASLKTGVRASDTPLVVITDADGTYPNCRIPELASALKEKDMIVGARTKKGVKIPLIRKPAKWMIRMLAAYLARTRIPDLNSGLRVFRRSTLEKYLGILPDGFSFTTTITLAMLTRGHELEYIPIHYSARVGNSKIRPIRDTLNFIQLIIRTVLLFEPLRIFVPLSFYLFLASVSVGAYSYFFLDKFMDMTTTVLMVGALQILGIGMLAEMINRRLDR